MRDYTPTTQDVSDGFSLSYTRDYEPFSEGWYEASRFGVEAFKRWLSEHDRQTSEKAWYEGMEAGQKAIVTRAFTPNNPYEKETNA